MDNNSDLKSLRSYLRGLHKEELIKMIFEFVPGEHLRSFDNTRVTKNEALIIFEEIKNKILSWFDDEELIREPYGMESGLANQLNVLKGLEHQILPEISEFILLITEKVYSALYKGYLDDYREDYSFQFPDEFIKLVNIVIQQLPSAQKADFKIQFQSLLGKCDGYTFDILKDLSADMQ